MPIDVEKLKLRDEAALKAFFDQIADKLYKYAASQTARQGIQPLDAEDIVNETIVRIFKRIDSIAEVENPVAYCFAVMKNVMRERARQTQRFKQQSIESLMEEENVTGIVKLPIEPATPESLLESIELLEEILVRLPPKTRRIFEMHVLNDMSFDEIAKALDMNVAAVRTWYYRSMRALKIGMAANEAQEKFM